MILIVLFMPDGIWGFVRVAARSLQAPERRRRPCRRCSSRAAAPAPRPCWRLRGLSKHFGGLKAVDEVDIAVRRGGVHALIGPNGSGKTTTLNVLSGLYRATSGQASS